jgi:SAM-dependent methyltransferase
MSQAAQVSPPPPSPFAALRRRLLLRTRVMRGARRAREEWLGMRMVWELALDLRYGGWCGGRIANPFAAEGAVQVQSTHYDTLARVFRAAAVRIGADDVLVDVGCGKGRVINAWLHRGWRNRMVGLELVEPVAEHTRRRLRRWSNVRIVNGDAVANLPADGTLFYLYNPFGPERTAAFAAHLAEVARRPERVRVVYLNPRHLSAFTATGRWTSRLVDSGAAGEPAALLTLRPSADTSAPVPV